MLGAGCALAVFGLEIVSISATNWSDFVTERNKIWAGFEVLIVPEIIGNENVGTNCGFSGWWVEVGVVCLGVFGAVSAPLGRVPNS